jgi:hypothetical protein
MPIIRSSIAFASLLNLFLAQGVLGQGSTSAQGDADQGPPKYSNEFLAIGVGARALGMGNAAVALCNDVTAAYWNPAGLVGATGDLQIGAMHSEYFAGIAKYDWIGLARPIDTSSTLAVSFVRLGIDDIPNTIDLVDPSGNVDYDRITSFSAADQAFILSYARKLKIPGLRVGGNAKVIYRRVGSFAQAWGFGLDAGAQYRKGNWLLAAAARDVTSTFNAWTYSLDDRTIEVFESTGNELPTNSVEVALPRLLFGAARAFGIGKRVELLAALDLENTFDGRRNTLLASDLWSADPRLGLEVAYSKIVYLRLGASNVQYITDVDGARNINVQPNMGLGLRLKSVHVDYALTNIGQAGAALYSNIFSLRFDLYKNKSSS